MKYSYNALVWLNEKIADVGLAEAIEAARNEGVAKPAENRPFAFKFDQPGLKSLPKPTQAVFRRFVDKYPTQSENLAVERIPVPNAGYDYASHTLGFGPAPFNDPMTAIHELAHTLQARRGEHSTGAGGFTVGQINHLHSKYSNPPGHTNFKGATQRLKDDLVKKRNKQWREDLKNGKPVPIGGPKDADKFDEDTWQKLFDINKKDYEIEPSPRHHVTPEIWKQLYSRELIPEDAKKNVFEKSLREAREGNRYRDDWMFDLHSNANLDIHRQDGKALTFDHYSKSPYFTEAEKLVGEVKPLNPSKAQEWESWIRGSKQEFGQAVEHMTGPQATEGTEVLGAGLERIAARPFYHPYDKENAPYNPAYTEHIPRPPRKAAPLYGVEFPKNPRPRPAGDFPEADDVGGYHPGRMFTDPRVNVYADPKRETALEDGIWSAKPVPFRQPGVWQQFKSLFSKPKPEPPSLPKLPLKDREFK